MKKEREIISGIISETSLIMFLLAGFLFCSCFISAAEYSGNVPNWNFYTTISCNSSATAAWWVNYASTPAVWINASNKSCGLYSSIPQIPSCCPTSQTCNFDTGNCYDGSSITRCDKYNNSRSCNADDMHVGSASVTNSSLCTVSKQIITSSGVCFNVSSCGCYWNTVNNNCSASISSYIDCLNGGTTSNSTYGVCEWYSSVVEDNCNNSKNTITVNSAHIWHPGTQITAPAWCADIPRTYICPPTAKLSFISDISLIIAVLLIILVYILLAKRRKKIAKNFSTSPRKIRKAKKKK